jgi:hypothetical protein
MKDCRLWKIGWAVPSAMLSPRTPSSVLDAVLLALPRTRTGPYRNENDDAAMVLEVVRSVPLRAEPSPMSTPFSRPPARKVAGQVCVEPIVTNVLSQ